MTVRKHSETARADAAFACVSAARYFPAFLAVARHRSFTKAARALHLSQPAVTMAVHQLELALGVKLFERNTHGVALTSHGIDLVPTAERVMADLEAAIRHAQDRAPIQEQLRISAVHSVAAKILPHVASRFVARRSDVQIVLQDNSSSHVWRRVKTNSADIGFSSVMIDDSELFFEPLFRDQLGLLACAEHPLFSARGEVRWSDLTPFEYVRLSGDAATELVTQMHGLPENIVHPRYVATYNTLLWEMLRGTERISIVPALFTPDRVASGLAFLPLYEPAAWRNVYAVTPKRLRSSEVIDDVLALVKDVVAEIAGENAAVERL